MHLDSIGIALLVLSFVSFFALMIRGFVLGDVLRVSDAMFFFVGGLCLFFIEVLFSNGRVGLALGVGVCLITIGGVGFAVRSMFVSKLGLKPELPHRSQAAQAARARAQARAARDLVTTQSAMLALTLDRETQELSGAVLSGSFQGRALESLKPREYAVLQRECERTDPEGVALLSAWVERRGVPEVPAAAAPAAPSVGGAAGMGTPELVHSRDEALSVLGLQATADAGSVQSAYRTLKGRLTSGDSAYLARMLDEAYVILMQAGQTATATMGRNAVCR